MELTGKPRRLFAIGGGEDREHDCDVLRKFVDIAGGEASRIVVLTTASNKPEKYVGIYEKAFERIGVAKIDFVHVFERRDANNADCIKTVENATGIFFTGGNQLHITSLMGGTDLQTAIFTAYQNNVIIAGTSAGAAMMGTGMILHGRPETNPRMGSIEMATGTGFIDDCVIDTHFSERGRHGRLLTAVAHYPQYLGFGVDEDTAILVENDSLEVFGEGSVTVFDASQMTFSDIPYVKKDESIALANVIINVLSKGYKFDLKTRRFLEPEDPTRGRAETNEMASAAEAGNSQSK